jgi:hypothetical protein
VKGLSLCGLRGVERQIGSTRWTQCPNGIKYGPHGGKKTKTKLGTVSWLSLKTKVEPGRRGSQVMSGIDVEAAPSPRDLRWFTTKSLGSLIEPQSQDRRLGGLRWDLGTSRDFEVEDTC